MTSSRFKKIVAFIPAICWMLMIIYFSHMQGGESGALSEKIAFYLQDIGINLFAIFGDRTVWVIRKLAHMSEYAMLFFLLRIPLRSVKRGEWLALAVAVAFAGTDEIHQSFIPGRVATIYDVGFDSLGASIAFFISYLWTKISSKFV